MPTKASVLITGCSAGSLGSALAIAFQARGLHVFATARNVAKMEHLAKIPSITLLQLDVTSRSSVAHAVQVVKMTGDGKLRYLINNAGGGFIAPLLDADIDNAKEMFEVNVWGLLRTTQAFASMVVEEKGTIVNIGSSAGVVIFPFSAIYGASKAAVNLLSETLRLELEPLNVKVITIVAGIISSNFHANIGQPENFSLPPGSMYKSMEGIIREKVKGGALSSKPTSAEDFAEEVVKNVLGGRTGKTYSGALAWAAKWAIWWFPGWLFEPRATVRVPKGGSVWG